MTKSQLIDDIQSRLPGATKLQVKAFLDAITETAEQSLRTEGVFVLPDLIRIVVVETAAKPERTARNPATGAQITLPPKPAGKKLRVRLVKHIKKAVG